MTKQHFFRRGPLLGIIAVALIWVASAATPADALVAAGTSIDNAATVSYTEGADVTSNTVSTTVNLVSGLAWDDASLTPVTQTYGSTSALTVDYTVDLINLGNGATTATISNGTTESTPANLTAGTWTINGVASPAVLMGGTVSSAAATPAGANTDIPVSFVDLAALVPGDTVRIGGVGGNDYVVAAGSTATNLIVVGDATADVASAGVQIGEVSTITFTGTTGTLSTTLSESHNHAMTATDDVGGGLNADGNAAASDTVNSNGSGTLWQTFVTAGVLSIDKYVRNVTSPNAGATSIVYAGNTYYQTGVTGDSTTDTLEYLIIVSNAGPGDATDVTVADDISTFLSLVTTSVDIDTNGDGAFDRTDAVNNNGAAVAGTVLTVYAGDGGLASGPNGGVVAFDATPTSAVRFQAAIQ